MDQDLVPLRSKFERTEEELLTRDSGPALLTKASDKNMSEMKVPDASAPKVIYQVGPKSSLVDCPYCHACIKTTIEYTTTTRTHILATLMCLLCCLCSCCTYCRASTRNTDHYCPNCTRFLGTYKK